MWLYTRLALASMQARPSRHPRFIFWFIHTRIQPYVDYGGVLVTHFFPSAVPPRYVKHPRAGPVAAPSPPKPSAYPPAFPASTGI